MCHLAPWDFTYWELRSMAEGARPEAFQRSKGSSKIRIDSGNISAMRSIVDAMGKR